MLLRKDINVISSISIELYFDDDSSKKILLNKKDIVSLTYNDRGVKTTVVGKVINIISNGNNSYLSIDGSGIYEGSQVKILFDEILDCIMIEKYDESILLRSVSGAGQITNLRLLNGYMQISTDNGVSWKNLTIEPETAQAT